MRFVHLTDFHLRDPASSDKAADHATFVADCLRELANHHADIDLCVITGDLTDAGEPGAYKWLAAELARLPFPTRLLIGNHDSRENFLTEFGGQGHAENGYVQSEFDAGHTRLLFLDTNKPASDAGTLCGDRLAWLESRLFEARGTPVLLFMHHPACKIGEASKDQIRLDNPDAMWEILKEAGNVRHIFFGHVHRSVFVNWNGIPCTSLHEPRRQGLSANSPLVMPIAVGMVDDGQVILRSEILQILASAVGH